MIKVGGERPAGLSRVTLVGTGRRVDLLLPSDEPVGLLLPEVLPLLNDQAAARPMLRHLVTTDGTVLPQDTTLADAGVTDGAVLRLVRTQDAPSAPVVHDVTDEVADDLDLRAWRWRPKVRRPTAGLVALVLALTAGRIAVADLGAATAAGWLLGAAAVLAVAGVPATRLLGNRGLGTTLLIGGGVLGLLGAWTLADAQGWPPAGRWGLLAGVAVLTLALLGLFSPIGRGGLIGGAAVLALAVLWEVTAALLHGAPHPRGQAELGAVLAVCSVVALGVLPRLALVAAGLTGLDDRRAGGVSVSRHAVTTALAAAHRGLALATVAGAGSAAAAGWLLVSVREPWTVLLAVLTAVVLLARARAYPLVAEVGTLLAAALVLLVRLVTVWPDPAHGSAHTRLVVLCLLVLLPLAVLAVQPPEHVQVRLRRAADLVEAIGIVALFPLAVGVFGVYARLLGAF
ncbi:type VII secretion integral membrane protein EccD [Kitasatospora sp. NPDC052896]|uniref:type VII secretion integral membrane protein EccD n=1 Tax=Kitasatospora sp. NPDC052896 TaxID=3364061 RepID=UPI0037C6E489